MRTSNNSGDTLASSYLMYEDGTMTEPRMINGDLECETSVLWVIMAEVMTASESQIAMIPKSVQGNVRETKPRNQRAVKMVDVNAGSD